MSRPVVSAPAERIYASVLPYQGGDADGGWLLLVLCEAAARTLGKPTEALRDDDVGSGWRRAYDPDRTPAWMLPWLAKHVGLPEIGPLSDAQVRALVRDAPRMRRGSIGAFTRAPRIFLANPNTDRVEILERDGGAYRVTVATYTSQTPDPAAVLAALLEQKPAGLVLTYVVSPGWIVGVLEAAADDYPNVGGLEAAFPTVTDLEDYIP